MTQQDLDAYNDAIIEKFNIDKVFGFFAGVLRLEAKQQGDVVKNADGTYDMTFRFTLLPKVPG